MWRHAPAICAGWGWRTSLGYLSHNSVGFFPMGSCGTRGGTKGNITFRPVPRLTSVREVHGPRLHVPEEALSVLGDEPEA